LLIERMKMRERISFLSLIHLGGASGGLEDQIRQTVLINYTGMARPKMGKGRRAASTLLNQIKGLSQGAGKPGG